MQRDFDSLKAQLLRKEQGVKTELERAWSDWEERCRDIEEQKTQAEFRLQESDTRVRDLTKQL
jgi:hypothetical protein